MYKLTRYEKEVVNRQKVIDRLFLGWTQEMISKDTGLKIRTIKKHINTTSRKLEIDRRLYLPHVRIVYLIAKEQGLIK